MEISIFGFIYQPFELKNKTKSRSFKIENNAWILPKQLQNNFEKVQKTTFSTLKTAKTRVSIWLKNVNFCIYFRSTSYTFALLVRKKMKSIPLIAKDIEKKKKKNPSFSHLKNFIGKYAQPSARPPVSISETASKWNFEIIRKEKLIFKFMRPTRWVL